MPHGYDVQSEKLRTKQINRKTQFSSDSRWHFTTANMQFAFVIFDVELWNGSKTE